jgi:hypothetical protein
MKLLKLIKNKIARCYRYLILIRCYSTKLSFSNSNQKKQIIICFDGNFSHGGLVDRIKGIISFYEISKILNCEFKIFFNHPFELTDFLKPNKLDWTLNEKDLKYSVLSSKILYLNNDFKTNPLELLKKSKAKTFFVYCNVDYLSALYPNKIESELSKIWRNNYLELFKSSHYLKEKLVNISGPRIAFHTRFTTLMGDFSDSTKLILNEKEKQDLIRKVVKSIDETIVLYPDKTIYVLSDSEFFLNYIKSNTSYKTLEGSPKHLENNKNRDIDFHIKTFLDFYFLIKSDMIFLIKIDQMHNSSFSKYASILGNRSFKRITN